MSHHLLSERMNYALSAAIPICPVLSSAAFLSILWRFSIIVSLIGFSSCSSSEGTSITVDACNRLGLYDTKLPTFDELSVVNDDALGCCCSLPKEPFLPVSSVCDVIVPTARRESNVEMDRLETFVWMDDTDGHLPLRFVTRRRNFSNVNLLNFVLLLLSLSDSLVEFSSELKLNIFDSYKKKNN